MAERRIQFGLLNETLDLNAPIFSSYIPSAQRHKLVMMTVYPPARLPACPPARPPACPLGRPPARPPPPPLFPPQSNPPVNNALPLTRRYFVTVVAIRQKIPRACRCRSSIRPPARAPPARPPARPSARPSVRSPARAPASPPAIRPSVRATDGSLLADDRDLLEGRGPFGPRATH